VLYRDADFEDSEGAASISETTPEGRPVTVAGALTERNYVAGFGAGGEFIVYKP
jgi:hypothetical protein